MILIFTDQEDVSTFKVLEWLSLTNTNYILIYPETIFHIEYISIESKKVDINLFIDTQMLSIDDINGIWYRRGELPYHLINVVDIESKFIYQETKVIKEFLLYIFSFKPSINRMHSGVINKLFVLYMCKQIDLSIPKSLITEKSNNIYNYFNNDRIINKPIFENSVEINNIKYYSPVTMVDKVILDENYPSLYQNMIEKEYEIRTFHFFGKNYSMAMFTQSNEETKLDFRSYNLSKPNRYVPYNLPIEIDHKINKLMKLTDNNTGSIDIIYSKNKEYIILEINPVGQYDMVSVPCNYNLDLQIAKKLNEFNNVQ